MRTIIILTIKSLALIVPILLSVAYITLLERKVLAAIQRRRGPNYVGIFGLLQPLADGLKLFLKEILLPTKSNKILFIVAPVITLFISLVAWAVIPLAENSFIIDLNVGVLYLLATSSIGVYGIIFSGWASNSKYGFLGALRSAAQMISYEVSLGLIILTVVVCAQSANLGQIVLAQEKIYFVVPLFPFFVMFFISSLAETNRPPFDLPEAEAELVAGYNVEYSSMGFAYFFIAEYSNILLMSALTVIFFFGGWLPPTQWSGFLLFPSYCWFSVKVVFFVFLFIWVRASFPRYRFDQLMYLTWRIFLPISLAGFILVSGIVWSCYSEDFVLFWPKRFENIGVVELFKIIQADKEFCRINKTRPEDFAAGHEKPSWYDYISI